jgi:hypothetical protein
MLGTNEFPTVADGQSWYSLPLNGLCEFPVAFRTTLIAAYMFLGVFHVLMASDGPVFGEAGLAQALDAQDAELRLLREELDSLKMQMQSGAIVEQQEVNGGNPQLTADLASFSPAMNQSEAVVELMAEPIGFRTLYNRGFVIEPYDKRRTPFELKINSWIQFRHHAFTRSVDTWVDNSGKERPVLNRNAFDIERARLTFRGFAIDPRLTYFLQLDGDTDGAHTVDFFDYWWAWKVSDDFSIQVGKRKVPASRQWLLGARRTRLSDRPMSDDFFRPDRTVGIFGLGKVGDSCHYQVMVGNGYRTANLPPAVVDDRFTFAATSYIEPAGKFGSQLVDFDCTCNPLWQLGHSFVYSPQTSNELAIPLDESDFLRLADGTRLNQTGALAPGVTVSEFDLWFYGVDLAWKHRGWSADSEVFFRWIENLRGDGTLPVDSIFQHGLYVEGGKFLIDRTFDVNFRYSYVDGDFGNGSEFAGGFNWYPLSKPSLKFTFDVTRLDKSPLQNRAADISVGDSGVLFRSQFQAEF